MKKILILTVFLLSLLVGSMTSNLAYAQDTEEKTVINPFFQENIDPYKAKNAENKRELVYKATKQEIDLLAHMVYGEARGESKEGQVAIAAVILNRTKDPRFPKNIKDVLFEKDAFTAVNDGQFYMVPNKTAYEAVYIALQGYDPTEGATYYWNPQTATSGWVWSRDIIKQIGRHIFAR